VEPVVALRPACVLRAAAGGAAVGLVLLLLGGAVVPGAAPGVWDQARPGPASRRARQAIVAVRIKSVSPKPTFD